MELLYKKPEDIKVSVDIKELNGKLLIDFSADCGKFGTDESIAGFVLTPDRLFQILSERTDLSDSEF